MPEGGDEGADEELSYVDVAQDLDQFQKGPRPTLPAKESPGAYDPVFFKFCYTIIYGCMCI
jgi:hypothetical protein